MKTKINVEKHERGQHCEMCDGIQEYVAEITSPEYRGPYDSPSVWACKDCLASAIRAIDESILEDCRCQD